MTEPINVVAVSGSLHAPSKTGALLDAILEALAARASIETYTVEAMDFTGGLWKKDLSEKAQDGIARIEAADLLVVASPVYRATYTGMFKHIFDNVGQPALENTPVLTAATGGNDLHSLVIEHQFRPLFGFFKSRLVPVGVYGKDADFTDYKVSSPDLQATIDAAAASALTFL